MTGLAVLIKESQAGNQEATLQLLQQMRPLLVSYSRKLKYEDAYEDLQLFMLERIAALRLDTMKILSDGSLINYFKNAVKNEYIRLSKRKSQVEQNEKLSQQEEISLELAPAVKDDYSRLLVTDLRKSLNQSEYRVILDMVFLDLSVKEIAQFSGQTVWNIYKLRKNALEKLRQQIENIA